MRNVGRLVERNSFLWLCNVLVGRQTERKPPKKCRLSANWEASLENLELSFELPLLLLCSGLVLYWRNLDSCGSLSCFNSTLSSPLSLKSTQPTLNFAMCRSKLFETPKKLLLIKVWRKVCLSWPVGVFLASFSTLCHFKLLFAPSLAFVVYSQMATSGWDL